MVMFCFSPSLIIFSSLLASLLPAPLHIFQGLSLGPLLPATSGIVYSSNTLLIIMPCLSTSRPQSHSLSSLDPPIPKPVLFSHFCLHFIVSSLRQPGKSLHAKIRPLWTWFSQAGDLHMPSYHSGKWVITGGCAWIPQRSLLWHLSSVFRANWITFCSCPVDAISYSS